MHSDEAQPVCSHRRSNRRNQSSDCMSPAGVIRKSHEDWQPSAVEMSRRRPAAARGSFATITALAIFSIIACASPCSGTRMITAHGGNREGFIGTFTGSRIGQPKQRIVLPEIKINLPKVSPQGICNFLSGGVAGAFAAAITCPLEVVKTHLQSRAAVGSGLGPLGVAKGILEKEGLKGLYRGMGPTIIGIVPTRSTYFWAYSATKGALQPFVGDGPVTHIASAVAAGGLSNTVTCPLWMVKTRMQLTGGKLVDTVRTIVREDGVSGLYRGLAASYWGLTESCMQFLIYEKMKSSMLVRHEEAGRNRLSSVEYLFAAGVSKAVASVLTYPHEVVRTRMREAGSARYRSMFQSIRLIAKEEGTKGLYGGLGPHLMRVVPNTAIMFMSYELLMKTLPPMIEDGTVQRFFDNMMSFTQQNHVMVGSAAAIGLGHKAKSSFQSAMARLALP
jgi:solute carrier family 25 protein 33/36